MFLASCRKHAWTLYFFGNFFFWYYEMRVNVPYFKHLVKVTFEGLNVLANLYTICHICILWLCKYAIAKMFAQTWLQIIVWKFENCKYIKFKLSLSIKTCSYLTSTEGIQTSIVPKYFLLRGPSVEILGTHFFADSDRGGSVLLERAAVVWISY